MGRKRYYIAYGSNLSVIQMSIRCPDAKVAGTAILKDWKLVFRVHATIEPCKGRTVPVVIWEISRSDEDNLDCYEGYPHYYTKEMLEVSLNDKKVDAMVYIMTGGRSVQKPSCSYYNTLDNAYRYFGFNSAILKKALREAREETEHGLR